MAFQCRLAEDRSVQARLSHCSCAVGRGARLLVGAVQATRTDDTSADAAAQLVRGVADDAQDGLAVEQPTSQMN